MTTLADQAVRTPHRLGNSNRIENLTPAQVRARNQARTDGQRWAPDSSADPATVPTPKSPAVGDERARLEEKARGKDRGLPEETPKPEATPTAPAQADVAAPQPEQAPPATDAYELSRLRKQVADEQELQKKLSTLFKDRSDVDAEMEELRGKRKSLQERIDKMTAELLGLIGGNGEATLFDQPKPDSIASSAPTDATDADKAAFDKATLEDLGVTPALREKLEAEGIRNGAELQKWFAEHPPRKIRGVGESARDKLNELMARWYENRAKDREAAVQPAGDAPAKPATADEVRGSEATILFDFTDAGFFQVAPRRNESWAVRFELDLDPSVRSFPTFSLYTRDKAVRLPCWVGSYDTQVAAAKAGAVAILAAINEKKDEGDAAKKILHALKSAGLLEE